MNADSVIPLFQGQIDKGLAQLICTQYTATPDNVLHLLVNEHGAYGLLPVVRGWVIQEVALFNRQLSSGVVGQFEWGQSAGGCCHGDTFRVGWLNGCKKTGHRLINPILIGKGFKHLGFVETLGKQGLDN
jgi:hypothetical protein